MLILQKRELANGASLSDKKINLTNFNLFKIENHFQKKTHDVNREIIA